MVVQTPQYSLVSTISNVITAFCLMVLTITLVVGGTWTAHTVTELRHTYHPDQISGMITDLSETVGMIHTLVQNTTHHNNLKSSRGGGSQAQPSLFEDLHLLATSMEIMTNNLDMIPTFINEAHEWRYMTTDAYTKFKSVMTSL
jgi:hypothetical protein